MGLKVKPTQVRRGSRIKLDNDVYAVTDYQHVSPGKGQAFVRIKIKSLTTGKVLSHTAKITEEMELADVTFKTMQYLYDENHLAVFMDNETYDQVSIPDDLLGDDKGFLKESAEVQVTFYEGKPIGVELPPKVELRVTDTMAAVRGNTATNITKAATLETGATVQVPLFVNTGDLIRISTQDGSYVERVAGG